LDFSDLYAAGRHPLTCGTSTRKRTQTATNVALAALLLGVTVAMSVMSARDHEALCFPMTANELSLDLLDSQTNTIRHVALCVTRR
jgi:hypothetical protein